MLKSDCISLRIGRVACVSVSVINLLLSHIKESLGHEYQPKSGPREEQKLPTARINIPNRIFALFIIQGIDIGQFIFVL